MESLEDNESHLMVFDSSFISRTKINLINLMRVGGLLPPDCLGKVDRSKIHDVF